MYRVINVNIYRVRVTECMKEFMYKRVLHCYIVLTVTIVGIVIHLNMG